jgi:hypothetical protein
MYQEKVKTNVLPKSRVQIFTAALFTIANRSVNSSYAHPWIKEMEQWNTIHQ